MRIPRAGGGSLRFPRSAVTCIAATLLFAASAVGFASPPHRPGGPSPKPAACLDATPHEVIRVAVHPRVQLEVLDFGGAGKPRTMVLLTGLGDNAHVYDQFAYQFTDDFHVLGITRRGFLPSSQPAPGPGGIGYDVDTRARDDVAVLDALGIAKAVFVGHSVAGSELSALGARHKDRVAALVYLDAFDLSQRFQLPDIPGAPYSDADGRSIEVQIAAQARLEDIVRPVQELCILVQFDDHGALTATTTPPGVSEAILAGVQAPANPPVDWSDIAAPRLGIFNQPSIEGRLPYYAYLTAEDKVTFDARWPALVRWYADRLDEFAAARPGTPAPVVHRLPDVPHYFYINRQAFVVLAMRQFLLGSAQP